VHVNEDLEIHGIVTFINEVMRNEGFVESTRIENTNAIVRYLQASKGNYNLEVATDQLAEQMCFLDGINFKHHRLRLMRHQACPPPRFSCWNEYHLHRYGKNDPQTDRLVMVYADLRHDQSTLTGSVLVYALNQNMIELGLCKEDAVKTWRSIPSKKKLFILEMKSPRQAEHVCYLNFIPIQDSEIGIRRVSDWRGPRPTFRCYNDFMAGIGVAKNQTGTKQDKLLDTYGPSNENNSEENSNWKENIANYLDQTVRLQRRNSTLEEELATYSHQMAGMRNALSGRDEGLAKLRKQFCARDEELARLKQNTTSNAEVEAMKNRLNFLSAVQNESKKLKEDISKQAKTNTARLVQATEMQKDRLLLKKQLSAKETELASLQQSVGTIGGELATTKQDLSNARQEIVKSGEGNKFQEKESLKLKGTFTNLKKELAARDKTAERLRRLLTTRNDEVGNLESRIDNIMEELDITQQQLNDLVAGKKDYKSLQSQITKLSKANKSQLAELSELHQEISTVKETLSSRDKVVAKLQQEVYCKEQELSKHQSRLDKDEELITTRQQLHDVHESWQQLVQELAEKKHRIDDLATQLQDCQRNLQTVTETMVMQS
jgi:chromosome segregation ATPase